VKSESLPVVAEAVGKVEIPPLLRDFQTEGESPAFGLFHAVAFSTAPFTHRSCYRALFVYLDAAQLIKHTCGLSHVFKGQEVVLLYLFWEPANYEDFCEFAKHRDELDRFAQLSAGSGIKFAWKSYLDLWNDWANLSPEWARVHAASLLERYAVEI
jgi:hypothetical protein